MKKISLLFTLFIGIQVSFAQEERKLKTIEIDPIEYANLKQEGKLLSHFEYRFGAGNTQTFPVNQIAKTLTATPCDPITFAGTPLTFGGQLDDANQAVTLPFNFCFYGTNYTTCNVSTNGNVQFSTNSTAFSSTGFPSGAVNMIAAFWSDVDLRTVGTVKVDMYPTRMVITWDSVGYYNNHSDKTNSFQLILTDGLDPILPGGKNVGFFYKKMQWTTGDASGGSNGFPTTQPGTPATVGFNLGNGVDYTLVGRFGAPGSAYDEPLGNDDGVSWLDGKKFYFNVCPPAGSNTEPISLSLGYCDTIKVCGNDTLRIKPKFLAPEVSQTVSVTVNAPSLSGALTYSVFQGSGFSDLNIMINGAAATNGYHTVTINATDNGTPSLMSSYNVVVHINHSSVNSTSLTIITSPTIGICPGQGFTATANFSGTTPDSFVWGNGESTTITSYTLNSASDSLVFLTVNTQGCEKTFSDYIHVNPVPTAAIIGATTFCAPEGSTTVLTASNTTNYSAQAPYTYLWSGTSGTITTQQAINASQGSYSVVVTNNFNCSNSTGVNVVMNVQPQFTVTPTYTMSGIGGTVYFNVNMGNAPPSFCGLANSNCSSTNMILVGNGLTENANSTWPSVYGNDFKNSRHQMIFTASELLAAGLQPGKIANISFKVNSIPVGYVGTLPAYSIKLKCVSQSSVTTTFDNVGLTQVFAGNITPVLGINTHNFPQAYLWDGTSNLLVDVCYSVTAAYTSNPAMQYTTLGTNRCLYYFNDVTAACGTGTGTPTANRPNLFFGNCLSNADPNEYTYSWSPTTGLSDPTVKNPTLTVVGSQVYTVVVTNTNTPGCSGVNTVTIDIPTGINGMNKSGNTISIYPNPNNGKFEISLSGYDLSTEKLSLQITNTLGQTVYSSKISEARTVLNMQEFTSGVYFITISNDRKERVMNRVIIQR